jgi:hypothetical protein
LIIFLKLIATYLLDTHTYTFSLYSLVGINQEALNILPFIVVFVVVSGGVDMLQ